MKTGSHNSIATTALLTLLLTSCSHDWTHENPGGQSVLRLAVTTSTRDSGLLDVVIPVFQQQRDVRVDVIAVGTGAALKLGEAGDVDAVFVHAQEAEEAFMAAGHGTRREDVMYNSFELLGPAADPSGIREMESTLAFQRIAKTGQRFVSRGDDSGTHQRELKLWEGGGGLPRWEHYVETDQGQGATLTIADQMNAYVLTDRGTYLNFKRKIQLVPLVTSSKALHNPYGIMVVNPKKHSGINSELAEAFVDFLISVEAQQLIRDFKIDDEHLFYPHPVVRQN